MAHFASLFMPFGLTNAPPGFQGLFNGLLCDFLKHFVFVYLDNTFCRDPKEHQSHVRQAQQRLLENHLSVKAEKCEFHVDTELFGLHHFKRQTDPSKMHAVAE